MIIKVNKKDLFNTWLLWLDPILKLNKTERKILQGFLGLHYTHRHRYSDLNVLNELLFSEGTQKTLAKKLGIKEWLFFKSFKALQLKDLIQTKEKILNINPSLTRYPRDSNFKLTVQFQLQD